MADAGQVGKGVLLFFFGVILTITSYWIAPAIINLMPDATTQAICWIGLAVFWVFCLIIMPIWAVVSGSQVAE